MAGDSTHRLLLTKCSPKMYQKSRYILLVVVVSSGLLFKFLKVDEDAISPRECSTNSNLSWNHPCTTALLKDNYLDPPDPRPYNITDNNMKNSIDDHVYGKGTREMIQFIFSRKKGGFFVEAGALDGVHLSNTIYLEQEMSWTGLLVEPNPLSYKKLCAKHRKAWTSNTCISSVNSSKEIVFVALSDDTKSMNIQGSSHQYLVNIPNAKSIKILENAEEHYTSAMCFPLMSYLLVLGVQTVDLLSLDIQGPEKQVLDTLSWNDVNIRVVVAENLGKNLDNSFVNVMKERGYRLFYRDCEDYIFLKIGDVDLDPLNVIGWDCIID